MPVMMGMVLMVVGVPVMMGMVLMVLMVVGCQS